MVDRDSADVWSRQSQFRLNASLGVPPDAFSATGQDWGMPPYNWDAVAASDFDWLRHRARRNADLYDGYRVDHLVGFYRTYARPRDGGEPFFSPSAEPDQVALGEHVLSIFREPGAEIIAEDLGTVPDYVRESLARLGVPGFKVFRWERLWHDEGQPFRDPTDYPEISVAASGTHDTEPMAVWWDDAPPEDREKVNALPTIRRIANGDPLADRFDPHVRDVLIEALFASRSELVINPLQDVFGWRERINTPARVDDANWTFRLPWPIDAAGDDPEARERQQALRTWAERHGRL
jgi:4-alpha-glucanotransferase